MAVKGYVPEFLTEYPPKSGVHILDKAKVNQKLQISLVDLAEMQKLYLKYFVDKPVKEHAETIHTHNKIQYQRVNPILTFNYTNTYEALYPSNQTMVRHLHGNVETDIVLGYNPDDADFQEPANTDLLTFKKYYQRAYG